MADISKEMGRQVGLLIDRRGRVNCAVVGDDKSVFLPDLSAYRQGQSRLCGLRLIHTHLKGEPIDDDDLTDLALLRLDMVGAVQLPKNDGIEMFQAAHMLPVTDGDTPWVVDKPVALHELNGHFLETVEALEDEFSRVAPPRNANDNRERAVLINVSKDTPAVAEDSLAELKELTRSAGIEAVHTIRQRRPLDPKYVLGKGKLREAVIKAMQLGAEVLIFDLNLSPAQVGALARFTDLKVLDRTQVILDIFAQRAATREGKIQVELAQLRYQLPFLGMKQTLSALSRLTGGIGGRGPGETKLEVDRRRAQDRIAQLSREVKKLGNRRKLRRRQRTRNEVPIVSIVGYTNAGKSTLLNQLTQSEVTAQDALFATLNPVSRRLRFPREREIIITDTVGFIRDLPQDLMAAFRTTLEEMDDADLLLHVVDASSPQFEDHYETVQQVLMDLELNTKPCVLVYNKIDKCDPETLDGLMKQHPGIPISAINRDTFQPLLNTIEERLWKQTCAV